MMSWMAVDIALAVFFAYLAFRMHGKKRFKDMWFFVAVTIFWFALAVGQWFQVYPGTWPF